MIRQVNKTGMWIEIKQTVKPIIGQAVGEQTENGQTVSHTDGQRKRRTDVHTDMHHWRRHRGRGGAIAPKAILTTFPNRPDPLSFLRRVV